MLMAMVVSATLVIAQPQAQLERLTVPADRLPVGCALPQPPSSIGADGKSVRGGLWGGLSITTNPWSGTDPSIVSWIRVLADPPRRAVDGPPMSPAELARARLRLADDVEWAYAAVYVDASERRVIVTAYKLIERETVVRRVSGTGSACYEAVASYVREAMPR